MEAATASGRVYAYVDRFESVMESINPPSTLYACVSASCIDQSNIPIASSWLEFAISERGLATPAARKWLECCSL